MIIITLHQGVVMISPRNGRLFFYSCMSAAMFTGCNLSNNLEDNLASSIDPGTGQSLQARQSGNATVKCKKPGPNPSLSKQMILSEPWNLFDVTRWRGDGDMEVSGGFFHAISSASSTAADFISPLPLAIPSQGAILFSNRIRLVNEVGGSDLESGALIMVNVDTGGVFNNYAFVNFGYTAARNMVFVELFGSYQGQEFDQIKEISIPTPAYEFYDLNLWVRPNGYQVGFGEDVFDSVRVSQPLTSLQLFEVGVYGSRIDSTSIAVLDSKVGEGEWPKPHPVKCGHDKKRFGQNSQLRNTHIRMARERIKNTANPSFGLRCLANMKELPVPSK